MQARNQMHGKTFENIIKASGAFAYSTSDTKRKPNQLFDIEKELDARGDMPTSIKSSKGNTIALSDARNFWRLFCHAPFRMIVGRFEQVLERKRFTEIHEFSIPAQNRKTFFGDVALREIEDFHNGIGLNNFPAGWHGEARKHAKKLKLHLQGRLGILRLNPKIDSKSQRRLQCSVNIRDMVSEFQDSHELHRKQFVDLPLPLEIISTERVFT